MLLPKRTQFVAYLRPERVNAPRVFWCALKLRGAEGRALHSQKIAAVSSARFSRAEYLLAQAKSHFCVSALNLPIPRLTEGVKATRIFTVCSEKARR